MLFFKSKSKSEELLPPPPPFPSMELEEENPAISKETKPKKAEEEFEDLFKDVEALKPKKEAKKEVKAKTIAKKPAAKPIKEKKIKLKPAIKQVKKPLPIKKIKTVKETKPEFEFPELEDLEFKEPEFKLPKELELPTELEKPEELELPEILEDFDIEKGLDFEKDIKPETKPKEITEAEEEIKSAIEKIKQKEKPSFFKRLFAKREKTEEKEEQLFPEIPETDNISTIQSNINKAREALMKFDLETAKKNYTEIIKIYNNTKPEEQAKVYHDIRDLYFERKSAEELKV